MYLFMLRLHSSTNMKKNRIGWEVIECVFVMSVAIWVSGLDRIFKQDDGEKTKLHCSLEFLEFNQMTLESGHNNVQSGQTTC